MIKIDSADITLEFLQNVGNEEVHIYHKGEFFYFKFDIKKSSSQLAIHTNGAVDFSIKVPPVFQRSTWGKKISAHCIFIDDKTVTDIKQQNFPTAWLIGTKDRYYAEDYYEIVSIVQDNLEIKNNDVFYWGSSAGGTSSIALATLHKGSTAIANNPQTNISHFRRKEIILKTVFPNQLESEIFEKEKYRLSLASLMNVNKYVPRIFYIQNNMHASDLNNHLYPFIEELDKYNLDKTSITFWLYNDYERGHKPLLPDKTLEYLHTIMSFKHL